MSEPYHIVVCGSIVPDPLQTLEPVDTPRGPALKNEMMLPSVLDPWAAHALYEAARLAAQRPGSKVWLVSLAPRAKLQQVMMNVAQKVPFGLVAVEGDCGGFTGATGTGKALARAISGIEGLDRSRLLLFGGWESASRAAGAVMQIVAEELQIHEQFQGVDEISVADDDRFTIKERVEGGGYQVSECAGCPFMAGWATGNLPEPKNNPQVGMMNMRQMMPALQKASKAETGSGDVEFLAVNLPKQKRVTRVEKNMDSERIAREIVEWIQN